MKKFTTIALSLVCALSMLAFVGCETGEDSISSSSQSSSAPSGAKPSNKKNTYNDKTAKQVYRELSEKMSQYQGNMTQKMEMDADVSTQAEGMTIEMTMEMELESKVCGDNEYVKSVTTMNMLGQTDTSTSEITYVDGIVYEAGVDYDTGAPIKTKQAMTKEEWKAYNGETESNTSVKDISDATLEKAVFEVTADEVTLTVVMQGKEAETFTKDITASMSEGQTVAVDSITLVLHFTKDLNLKYMDMDFTMVMNMTEGVTMTATYLFDCRITYSDLGTTVVSAPLDADSYQDISADGGMDI